MRRGAFVLVFFLVVSVAFSELAWGAAPVIAGVQVLRGADAHPGGDTGYHDWIRVWVTDDDGANDIASVTVTDSSGVTRVFTPGTAQPTEWAQENALTVRVDRYIGGLPSAPPSGIYTVTVTDASTLSDTLSGEALPVAEPPIRIVYPAYNEIITDTTPEFTWSTGLYEFSSGIHVWDVSGETVEIWTYGYPGSIPSIVYNADGNALESELIPGHAYGWLAECWIHSETGATDPRMEIYTLHYADNGFMVFSPTPVIQDVQIDRGHDTDAPDWTSYHQRVVVTAADTDGASDIASVTITDTDNIEHVMIPGSYGWSQDDDYTIRCEWSQWGLLEAPTAGAYTIRVVDSNNDEDSLTTADAPAVSEVHPTLLTPVMDSVIYDAAPTFAWTEGISGSNNNLHLWEEGTQGEVWAVSTGSSTSVAYGGPPLNPNHTYLWLVDSWSPEDNRVTDSRVSIWTAQYTQGRFTLYGDWPETPPTLPGKIAYGVCVTVPPELDNVFWWWDGGTWGMGMTSIMGYNTDPNARVWLGPLGAGDADWSPDGGALLYRVTGSNTLWVDPLDGTPPMQIPGILGSGSLQWAPDGERICYDHPDGDIRIANADGSGERVVSPQSSGADKAAWSPDGVWISYRPSWSFDETWLVHPDGTEAHRLGIAGIVGFPEYGSDYIQVFNHTWSPDATRLAVGFVARRPVVPCDSCLSEEWIHGIGIISRDGGPITPIFVAPTGIGCCAGPLASAWSPDGTSIVFSSGHHLADRPGRPGFEPEAELWMINADGSGGLTRLTYDHSFGGISWWAPNTLVGISRSWTVSDVTVTFAEVTSDGSTIIIASDPPPAPAPDPLTFLEDQVYHISTTAEITGDITIALDYSDTNFPPVLGERLSLLLWDGAQWIDITTLPVDTANYTIRGQFTPGTERDWFVALALDKPPVPKAKVVFEGCTEGRPNGPALFVANADLTEPMRLTLPPRGPAGCGQLGAVLSPDATKVVFTSMSSGRLQVLDLSTLLQTPGQEPYDLLNEEQQPILGDMPALSPSGDRLIYGYWSEADENVSIRVVNPDGTGAHEISVADRFRYPDWSPDGTRVVFELATEAHYNSHLYLLENIDDPGGPTLRRLGNDDAWSEEAPHWSPDGTRIVFNKFPTGLNGKGPDAQIWLMNPDTGTDMKLLDLTNGGVVTSWCPFDGYIYYSSGANLSRVLPDGTDDQLVNGNISPLIWTLERVSWGRSGVWLDGLNALPGETVISKMGISDAEDLAGVQAQVLFGSLGMYSADLGDSILDWAMPSPVIQPGRASLLAYASDPENQSIWGPAHLFDLAMTNPPSAIPGETRLMIFDSLLLSNEWGDPIDRVSFAGGIHTIPFANLQVSDIAGPIGADPEDPMPVTVTVTALDRNGWTIPDCDVGIELGSYDNYHWRSLPQPVTPSGVAIVGGEWTGQVSLPNPIPSVRLMANWEDIGGYSNWFQAIGKGDANADNSVSIFDVIKIANMAIGRGTWADWQLWAGDLNRDHEVNVFDVIICANKALEGMQSLSVGRTSPVVPAGSITVTTTTTSTGTQTKITVELSDCAGLAGAQVELAYDSKKLKYAGMTRGALLKSSWASLDNDLSGTVKAIAYTASGDVLSGGKGTLFTFTFNTIGKGAAKVEVTSVKLADAEGGAVTCEMARGRSGGKPGGK